ncbi:MAG TPA: hypothetical protein VGB77_07200 [Abditibacteriaceae bacterium]
MGWRVTGNDFSEADLREALDEVVDETASEAALDAGGNAPVLSGALSRSFYKSSAKGSDYQKAVAAMRAQNPGIEVEPETPREDWSEDDIHNGLVDSTAPHAPLIEEGHFNVRANRFIAGRPSLGNALRGQSDKMMSRAARALRKLGAKNVSKA